MALIVVIVSWLYIYLQTHQIVYTKCVQYFYVSNTSYFGRIMRRQGSLEKTTCWEKMEGRKKREKPNMRWLDSIKGDMGMSLQELSRTVEDRTL